MPDPRIPRLELLLRERGLLTAREIAAALGISQPTVSRTIAAAPRILRIGRARATRYALLRDVARAGHRWPLYRLDAQQRTEQLGELRALAGGGFHFEPARPLPAFLHGEFADGLFPGLPWFLDDQCPQGFLGRAFARRLAADIGAPEDLARWGTDDVLLALLQHGQDLPGDLLLGERALRSAARQALDGAGALPVAQRAERYPALAEAALRGDPVGSSAGGEQPKFVVRLDPGDGTVREAIVKFSEAGDAPAAQRWADLLRCEAIAGDVLRAHGVAAAQSSILVAGGRTFLESIRFDRTPDGGRRGFVSLAALDAAFHGHGRIDWWRYAPQLEREGWINADAARRLAVLGWFGALIANSDMHLGNAGLVLDDRRPLALAPAYDMLPMLFRPAVSGEVVARPFEVSPPLPEQRAEWSIAARAAAEFWRRIADTGEIGKAFRSIAASAAAQIDRVRSRHGD
ncbi:type II toxin-antitoxin system HipA family toxin YjjJ [Luteimonas huabeiensis]|uniref:type II toxin-antitoxin system HipA family toxin YjjJ n=1 Tax=Luteimonas huabeiensis TaxID=1244513 RepID=UPI0005B783E2|nr:type II toxin-antitoxin system HipA family toxin YjjJ [Luteimonas huabeiensis]